MKKNKTVAYLMAAALLVGGTFLGTKAWFFSNKAATNDLVITTGKMDVSVSQEGQWSIYNQGNNSAAIKSKNGNFTGVQPGDSFKKTITIENTGNLPQKISVGELQPLASVQTIKDLLLPEIGELATGLQEKIKGPMIDELNKIDLSSIGLESYKNLLISMIDSFDFAGVAKSALENIEVEEMLTYEVDRTNLASQLAVDQSTKFDIITHIEENYGITGDEKAAVKEAMNTELARVLKEHNISSNSTTGKLLTKVMNLVIRNIENPIESLISDIFENKQLEFKYLCEPIKVEATQVDYIK